MKIKTLSKKHITIGSSIIAIVLLILGSLTNVVGYQSVKSTVNDSPLFTTRTQRAINQQQNIITSQYLGIGKGNLLQFPIRDNRTEQLNKAIDIISNMDDTTFAQFTELCIQKATQDDTLRDLNRYEIVQALLLLKTNPEAIISSFIKRNNQNITSSDLSTICNWIPGCVLLGIYQAIMYIVVMTIVFIVFGILSRIPTAFSCHSVCICAL